MSFKRLQKISGHRSHRIRERFEKTHRGIKHIEGCGTQGFVAKIGVTKGSSPRMYGSFRDRRFGFKSRVALPFFDFGLHNGGEGSCFFDHHQVAQLDIGAAVVEFERSRMVAIFVEF